MRKSFYETQRPDSEKRLGGVERGPRPCELSWLISRAVDPLHVCTFVSSYRHPLAPRSGRYAIFFSPVEVKVKEAVFYSFIATYTTKLYTSIRQEPRASKQLYDFGHLRNPSSVAGKARKLPKEKESVLALPDIRKKITRSDIGHVPRRALPMATSPSRWTSLLEPSMPHQ